MIFKGLSIRQPWTWAILNAGKDIENRTWSTDYRGPLIIHSSKTFIKEEYYKAADFIYQISKITVPEPEDLDFGGVVGVCDLTNIIASDFTENSWKSPWKESFSFGWQLKNPKKLKFRPLKGGLRLFNVDINDHELRVINS